MRRMRRTRRKMGVVETNTFYFTTMRGSKIITKKSPKKPRHRSTQRRTQRRTLPVPTYHSHNLKYSVKSTTNPSPTTPSGNNKWTASSSLSVISILEIVSANVSRICLLMYAKVLHFINDKHIHNMLSSRTIILFVRMRVSRYSLLAQRYTFR